MKTALISFHNAYNYGAGLQAYALQEAVKELGSDCTYIDYQNSTRADWYKMSVRIKKAIIERKPKELLKNICGAPFVLRRGRKFKRFYKKYLSVTPDVYHSCREAGQIEDEFDKFICGSDQIWNKGHNGNDGAFLLEFVKDRKKKISYASSFGMEFIPDEEKEWYARRLAEIPCLSTREKCGVEIIQQLTGQDAKLVLDPVFLLSAERWKSLIPGKIEKRFTFYYNNANFSPDTFRKVTGWTDHETRILSAKVKPSDFLKSRQKVTFAMSPQEFLQQIHDAELVVTTSFHCLAFSIIFHKQFVAVLSGDEGRDERLLSLLKITGLEKRIFSRTMTSDAVNEKIDYTEVDKRLREYIEYSLDFLRLSLFEGSEALGQLVPPEIPEKVRDNYICNQFLCSGCGACSVRCPRNAISMKPDQDGFLYPVIDKELCNNCGICRKVCGSEKKSCAEKKDRQRYFAYKNNDADRLKSSSGGAFRLLAKSVIEKHGIVIAASMSKTWELNHTAAYTTDEVEEQGKTWYVQGNAFCQFKNTEQALKAGKTVLFTGTPCQVAGLYKYLHRDYDNLLTCDIICHGVPSPAMFLIFVKYLQSRGELNSLCHRDKEMGWKKGYTVSAVINGKKYRNKGWLKAYSVMFSHNLINRTSCFHCPYANYQRCSDISIGDYWGIERYHQNFKDKLGVSLVMTNTHKGEEYFLSLVDKHHCIELEQTQTLQNSLCRPASEPSNRLNCLIEMQNSYVKASRKYGEWNMKGLAKDIVRAIRK